MAEPPVFRTYEEFWPYSPWWSLRADFRLYRYIWMGRLRIFGS
jgi:hypothetical protein